MKSFLFVLFILISFDLFAQTITPIPIYKGSQSLTIDILQSGRIWFGFQNPDYQTIVDKKKRPLLLEVSVLFFQTKSYFYTNHLLKQQERVI